MQEGSNGSLVICSLAAYPGTARPDLSNSVSSPVGISGSISPSFIVV